MRKLIIMYAMVVAAAGTVNAAPTTLFDTFGPGDTYDIVGGWTIGTPFFGTPSEDGPWETGHQFTIGATYPYYLDRIELAVALADGANELDVWLATDAGGEPGTPIEEFYFNGAMGTLGDYNPPLTADSALHPILYPGTPYWLVASAPEADTWAAWNWSSPKVVGTLAQKSGMGPWNVFTEYTIGAFRITGSPIPAPGAILLSGIGIGCVSWLRRRRTL